MSFSTRRIKNKKQTGRARLQKRANMHACTNKQTGRARERFTRNHQKTTTATAFMRRFFRGGWGQENPPVTRTGASAGTPIPLAEEAALRKTAGIERTAISRAHQPATTRACHAHTQTDAGCHTPARLDRSELARQRALKRAERPRAGDSESTPQSHAKTHAAQQPQDNIKHPTRTHKTSGGSICSKDINHPFPVNNHRKKDALNVSCFGLCETGTLVKKNETGVTNRWPAPVEKSSRILPSSPPTETGSII